jgi:hypothetical protein
MGFGRFITTIVLFIILSPGVLLNLPGLGEGFMGYSNIVARNQFGNWGLNTPAVWMTRQTSLWSVVVHALVFALVMSIVNTISERFVNYQKFENNQDNVMDTVQGWWNRATQAVGMNA